MTTEHTPGTWGWAKYKINQGFGVARPDWPAGIFLTEAVNVNSGTASLCLCKRDRSFIVAEFKATRKEFKATDWEVVE